MKKTILAALIAATAMAPPLAYAQRGDRDGRGGEETRGDRPNRGNWRQSQPDSGQPQAPRDSWRNQGTDGPRNDWRAQEPDRQSPRDGWRGQQPSGDWNRPTPAPAPQPQPPVVQQPPRQDFRDGRQDFRQDRRDDRQDFRQDRRDDRQDFRQDRRDDARDWRNGDTNGRDFRQDRRDDRQDFRQDRRDDRWDFRNDRRDDRRDFRNDWRGDRNDWRGDRNDRRNWSNDWRRDTRYDWRDYRTRNRNVYRLPRYYAPRGYDYGYRRFSIGLTIGSILFGPQYWINDPWIYRLPPAYGPYRWVRYYNDALLVDIDSGLVVDVIYDIFW